ncbi:B12-binding domain-containing radical SAM protein [bacterium]|nr:B12-binding domain-containing radical SAM protein [bacterium]
MRKNKIVLVQREIEDKLGPMILSAYLKTKGHDSRILIDPQKNIKILKKIDPDFIGISLLSPSVDWAISTCRYLKKHLPGAKTILGGPHPTFFPKIIEQEGVDMVCIGEGEKSLSHLLENYNGSPDSVADTPNLWIKSGKKIIKNPIAPLLTADELTQLPHSDRSHYKNYPALKKNPHKKVWTSRGCAYSCSYCFNQQYKQIYKGLGRMVRQRSVDSVIDELVELKKISWQCLEIPDDHFLISEDWTMEFCEKYAKLINMPFTCCSTAKMIKHPIVAALKKAGCKAIYFAVETGVEKIRRETYNKPIKDEDIYNAADALHSNGVPFLTFNMIGLPDESLEDIYQTIRINQKIRTPHPWCSILQPYPGTKIAEIMNGGADDSQPKFTYSYFQMSPINDTQKQKLFFNAQKLFAHMVKSNTSYQNFVRLVQNPPLKINALYPLVFYWNYGNDLKQRYGMKWNSLFRYWLYSV